MSRGVGGFEPRSFLAVRRQFPTMPPSFVVFKIQNHVCSRNFVFLLRLRIVVLIMS